MAQFIEFAGVARPHQTLHAVARNGEYVVEIGNTRDGQSLPAAKNHFGWELTDRPGNERDYDRANVFENCIAGQDHDRSAADWLGAIQPTRSPHASRVVGLPIGDIR